MSLGLDLLQEGWDCRKDVWGEDLTVGGMAFRGIILPLATIEPDLALTEDIRETSQLQIHRDDEVTITQGNIVTDSAGNNYKVIGREDNPSDFVVKYTVVKVVGGLDP